jgi:hypothetical protein
VLLADGTLHLSEMAGAFNEVPPVEARAAVEAWLGVQLVESGR